MAQDKTMAKSDEEHPRDEDGRFTEKEDSTKASGTSGSGSKSAESDNKSSGGSSAGSKGASEKPTTFGVIW